MLFKETDSLFACALLGLCLISYWIASALLQVFLLGIFANRNVCKLPCAMGFSEPWLN